ncbi:glycosyltransferase [Tepidibacillus marianensis]|uniref:glycosyltransferase n=1 Tax=Tepidibacillus marianensis TaxID=3131995 RepID=UPI0030D27A9E
MPKLMKILVISHMYPSSFNMTSGIFVHEQVKALVKQGHEVKVISPVPWAPFPLNQVSKKWNRYSQIETKTKLDGIDIYYTRYLNLPSSMLFEYYGSFFYLGMKKLIENLHQTFPFDIIHAHVALPDGAAAIKIKDRFNVPLVVTIHGQDLQHTIYRNKKSKEIIADIFNRADKVILVSSKLKSLAEYELGSSDKYVVIHNGINLDDISSEFIEDNKTNERIILSLSNLYPSKGIDLNIHAISKLCNKYPDLKYVIVGDGPERNRLESLANGLLIQQNVEFVGRLPHEMALEYIKTCEIFSLPSWKEGFGIAYIEAMAYGKPVIGVKGEGIEDVIQQNVTGLLVKPKNVESLVEAIDYLLANQKIGKEIGRNAQEMVYREMTWDINVQKTVSHYKAVIH